MDIATLLGLFIGVTVVTLAIMTGSDLLIFLNLEKFQKPLLKLSSNYLYSIFVYIQFYSMILKLEFK